MIYLMIVSLSGAIANLVTKRKVSSLGKEQTVLQNPATMTLTNKILLTVSILTLGTLIVKPIGKQLAKKF